MNDHDTPPLDQTPQIVRDVQARTDRNQSIGLALLIAIAFVTLAGLVATIYTATQAVQASRHNRILIDQIHDEAHRTRLLGEDVLARLETNRQAISALTAGGPVPTPPPRASSPEPATTPRPANRRPSPPRHTPQPAPATPSTRTPPISPSPCPLPVCP